MRATGASAATIRRDFDYLARENIVQRIRGGAKLLRSQLMVPFVVREVHMEEQKTPDRTKSRHVAATGRCGDH